MGNYKRLDQSLFRIIALPSAKPEDQECGQEGIYASTGNRNREHHGRSKKPAGIAVEGYLGGL
jgi:hypothetical protein